MFILVLMIMHHINEINSKLVMHENQLNTLTAELVTQNATLLEEKILESTCQWEMITSKKYEIIIVNSSGEETKGIYELKEEKSKKETMLVKTAVRFDEIADKRSISRLVNPREGLDCNITTYPHLNCYHQDDYNLIETIKQKILYPPSILDYTERFIPYDQRNSQYDQDAFLDQVIFGGTVKNGFFVEAGADDFLSGSNTLVFEEKYKWTGLLIEPFATRFKLGY